jgi:polyketide biosynthesis enoyl-CoA hydratase PksH
MSSESACVPIYETIKVQVQGPICFLQIDRPQANNTIDDRLVTECTNVLAAHEDSATVVVLGGLPEVFCMGADFKAIAEGGAFHAPLIPGGARASRSEESAPGDGSRRRTGEPEKGPGPLYDLWLRLATGPYVTISHVRGKTNAGGVGFVAASDIVLADETAQFSLSELLFGLYPACVLPFLIRRVGFQKAHYLTLMTQPISAKEAYAWGLVDAFEAGSDALLRRHLQRLRRLSKAAIRRYKTYMNRINPPLLDLRAPAVSANLEVFSDPGNLQAIARYVERGIFPWERS